MMTVKLRAQIGEDGTLRLAVPIGLPAGAADVVVVVAPDPTTGPQPAASTVRSGLFLDQQQSVAHLDIDAALGELSGSWQSKLSDVG